MHLGDDHATGAAHHYGIVINLPTDHTAATTNAAIITALAGLPAQAKKTLTWDQGVEMARHQELAAAIGVKVYFAEAGKPWQRGAKRELQRAAAPVLSEGH